MVDDVHGGVSSGSRLTGVSVILLGVRRSPILQDDHRSGVPVPRSMPISSRPDPRLADCRLCGSLTRAPCNFQVFASTLRPS